MLYITGKHRLGAMVRSALGENVDMWHLLLSHD